MSVSFVNASSQRIDVSGLSSLANVSGWTMMGRVRFARVDATLVLIDLSVGTSTNTRAALQITSGGNVQVQARSTDADSLRTTTASAAVVANTWYHIAGTVDYTTGIEAIYIDGGIILAGAVAFAGTATSNTNSVAALIGSDAGGTSGFLDGLLEDVRIYNKVLGPNTIQTIADLHGSDFVWDGLTNLWRLNDAPSGTLAGTGTVIDLSPTSARRNGTPVNSPTWDAGVSKFRRKMRYAQPRKG
jgi:hypothetical protein